MATTTSPVLDRVRNLVTPITDDLDLDLYDIEQRGATLRVTVDTKPGGAGGITLDTLALVTRLVSRELDHDDPVPGRYTLEVTSPGVERAMRTPAHFQREVGKVVNVRLSDVASDERRLQGTLESADDDGIVVDGTTVRYDQIDRARTVFEWGPSPKPGSPEHQRERSQKRKEMQ
ncbi:MAG: hypothetical protein H0X22_10865 [Acidimicrobiia bacterium]|nr:hypothetical protein [Acidimicrobiia bacterium]